MKRPSLAGSMKALQEDTRPDVNALAAPKEPPARSAPSPRAGEGASVPARRYAGMKTATIPFEPALHRALRVYGANEGITLEKLVQKACADYLERNGE